MNIDGVKMTRTLSSVRRCLAREQMRINATLLALESIGGHKDKMGESAGFEEETLIEEMIACQVDSCKNISLRMEYQEKRVEAQTAVVSFPSCYWLTKKDAHSYDRYTNSWRKKIQKL